MKPIRAEPTRATSMGLLFAGILFSVLIANIGNAAGNLPASSEVIRRMIERAELLARSGDGSHYTYKKRSLFEELDAHGQAAKSEVREYQVKWVGGLPLNRLVKIQNRDLSPEELEKEQEKEERFRRRFTTMDPKKMATRKENWLTHHLLGRYEFLVKERVNLNGRPTLLVAFKAREGKLPEKSIQDKLLNRLAGTLWVDEADADTAQVSINLVEPLSLGWLGILGSLSQCQLHLERQRVSDSAWINSKLLLQIQCRKLASKLRFRKTDEASEFQKVEAVD